MNKSRHTQHDAAIDWKDYARIQPGEYRAYCKWARQYRDPGFKRWVCLLLWEVLADDLVRVMACVPLWLPLGCKERPCASRRGKYLPEWIRANGGPPARRDRLSPNVFKHRMARVEIDDTQGPAPYSVIRKIVEWETGKSGHSVSQYTIQDRSGKEGVLKGVSAPCLSDIQASARTGVEGEHTPAHTQGAGESATVNPPKVEKNAAKTENSDGFNIRRRSVTDTKNTSYGGA